MPDEKNFFAGLFDFAFHHPLTRRIVKLLYILSILGGGITLVVYVVVGMQHSPRKVSLISWLESYVCLSGSSSCGFCWSWLS